MLDPATRLDPIPAKGAPMTDRDRRDRALRSLQAAQTDLTHELLAHRPPPLLSLNLTMRQLQCLTAVAVEPGIGARELASRLDVRAPTASRLTERLVGLGLVLRDVDEFDRRRQRLTLSPAGQALIGELVDANRAVTAELFAAVDIDVLEQAAHVSVRLAEQARTLGRPGSGSGRGVDADPTVGPEQSADGLAVAVAQFAASLEPAENLATLELLAKTAHAAGPLDLLAAPEAAMSDFGPVERALTVVAQPLDGPFVAGLAAIAHEHASTVVAGMFETPAADDDAGDRVYNTLVVVGPDGSLKAVYRKIHLYDAFGYAESDRLLPGPVAPVLVGVGGLQVGLMTCYDVRFPELAGALVGSGAQALVVPAAWLAGPHKTDHWTTLLRARAIETTSYVVAAGQCGPTYCGASTVLDPMGVTIAGLGNVPGIATARIDPDRVTAVRAVNPTLRNRRAGWCGQG